MKCWFRAGCLILSNCFEMAGKKSMSSFAARAAISLPIAVFSCPYPLHYFVLRLHPVFVKRSLKWPPKQIAIRNCCLSPIYVLSDIFFLETFVRSVVNPCLLYLGTRQGRNLRYLFHRCLCFTPRSPRTWTWSQSCWCGQLWVHSANQQYHFVLPWLWVQSFKTSIYDQQLQKKAAAT